MATDRYRFGPFMLDASRASLHRGDAEIKLRPRSFALLQHLLSHAGRLLTKDELLSALWPGVVVTEDSLTRCISEVRAALGDDAQTLIKTVPRRGYLFAGAVTDAGHDTPVPPPADAALPTPTVAANRRRSPLARWLAFTGAVLIGLALWVFTTTQRHPAPRRLSLIVLPFASLGRDAKQDYLADIVTDDLTIALSRLHGATVIATASAVTFKGKPVDLRQIGTELAVRYALQGSVQRTADRVRISARLMDTQTASSLWADQFDLDRADLLKTQDAIVTRLANALDAELVIAESNRSSRESVNTHTTLDAEDLAMQCDAAAGLQQGESGAPSYDLCEQALQLDPGNVRALVRLALYYGDRVERMQSLDPKADLARARGWVTQALRMAPRYCAAHCADAVVLAGEHRVRDAITAAEHCLALNPSHACGYRILATFHFFLAEPQRSLAWVDRGMRLSPRDHQMAAFLLFKGWGHFMPGQDAEALTWLRQAAAASPDSPSILAPLVSVLALTAHDEEAQAMLARYLSLKRTRSRTLAQWDRQPDSNPAFAQFAERFKSGLRRAGMPEH